MLHLPLVVLLSISIPPSEERAASASSLDRAIAILESIESARDGVHVEWDASVEWAREPGSGRALAPSTWQMTWIDSGSYLFVDFQDVGKLAARKSWSDGTITLRHSAEDPGNTTVADGGAIPAFCDDLPLLAGRCDAGRSDRAGRLSDRLRHAEVRSVSEEGAITVVYVPASARGDRYEETITVAAEPVPHLVALGSRDPNPVFVRDAPTHLAAELTLEDVTLFGDRALPARATKRIRVRYPGAESDTTQVQSYRRRTADRIVDPAVVERLRPIELGANSSVFDERLRWRYQIGGNEVVIHGVRFGTDGPITTDLVRDTHRLIAAVNGETRQSAPPAPSPPVATPRAAVNTAFLWAGAAAAMLGAVAFAASRPVRRGPIAGVTALVALSLVSFGTIRPLLGGSRGAEASTPEIDLGIAVVDGLSANVVRGTLSVRNDGDTPLDVDQVTADCGCLRATPTAETVPAHGAVDIALTMEISTAETKSVALTVLFSDGQHRRWIVRGGGVPGEPVLAVPARVVLGEPGESRVHVLVKRRAADAAPSVDAIASAGARSGVQFEVRSLRRLRPTEDAELAIWDAEIVVKADQAGSEALRANGTDITADLRVDGAVAGHVTVVNGRPSR